MSKVYNEAFKVGFGINLIFFLILNLLDFVISDYEYSNRKIKFDHGGYSWGFPFDMYRNYLGYPNNDIGFTMDGVVLNTFAIVACGFVVGFLSKSIWAKEKARELK